MDAKQSMTNDLVQLRDALNKVKSSADKYSADNKKSQLALRQLSQSLNELSSLNLKQKK